MLQFFCYSRGGGAELVGRGADLHLRTPTHLRTCTHTHTHTACTFLCEDECREDRKGEERKEEAAL